MLSKASLVDLKTITFGIAAADISKFPADICSLIDSYRVVEFNGLADGKEVVYNDTTAR